MSRAGPEHSVHSENHLTIAREITTDYGKLQRIVECVYPENHSVGKMKGFCESRLYIKRNIGLTSDTLRHFMDFGNHIYHTFSVQQFFPFTILN